MNILIKKDKKILYPSRRSFTLSKDDLNKYQETYDNTNIIITIQSDKGENN